MGAYEQYLAVRADLKERYPNVDWISMKRRSFNMICADVEATDLHHTVTYFFKGDWIDDSWITVTKKKCTGSCLHADYPQEDPHRIMPHTGAGHWGVNLKRKEGPVPEHWYTAKLWWKQTQEQ